MAKGIPGIPPPVPTSRTVLTEFQQFKVVCDRVEHLEKTYDVVTGRGVTAFSEFVKLVRPRLAKKHGCIVYWTGGDSKTLLLPWLKSQTEIFDLETFFQHKFCETKKILVKSN